MAAVVDATLLFDERVKCYSLMTSVSTIDYLKLVQAAYAQRGGLQHQRDALKTTTARRIRARMVSDVQKGAILPPVVIGVVVDDNTLNNIPKMKPSEVVDLISGALVGTISIIDGMQRTTALLAALDGDKKVADFPIRIECWIAKSTDSLIYRMLVLNTGQVPWNLSRQLQVVFAPLIVEMKNRVKFERILDPEKSERRAKAGEYSPDSLVELYIAFGLRKTDVDTQETLADEFSRLDVTDAIAEDRYNQFFYPVLQTMVDLDQAFSRLDNQIDDAKEDAPAPNSLKVLKKGRSVFDSRPARIGYIVSAAIAILGRVGMEKDPATSQKLLTDLQAQVKALSDRLAQLDVNQLTEFLKLDVLSERLYGQKRSAVGRYERAFFDSAFKVLIEEGFEVPSLEPAWRV
ncbi:MAG: hypothetical protein JWP26_1853 [Devosia sp.]|uniref:hypothetical protein n=1 Tax=Devosia sp. TaxID=1871048 RepID=UPI00260950E2|nr:hypothetical protein [Devosia sp.]MDB5586883.1 hypothetical protein [Devosia sp.]